jgi:hypothetical protein
MRRPCAIFGGAMSKSLICLAKGIIAPLRHALFAKSDGAIIVKSLIRMAQTIIAPLRHPLPLRGMRGRRNPQGKSSPQFRARWI